MVDKHSTPDSPTDLLRPFLRLTIASILGITCLPGLVILAAGADTSKLGATSWLIVWIPIVSGFVLWWAARRWRPILDDLSSHQAKFLDTLPARYVDAAIITTAAASLFLELSMIRWQSSVFPVFALYKNFSLLACFAGLGLGYALSNRRHISLFITPILLACQFIVLHGTRFMLPHESRKWLELAPILEQLNMGLNNLVQLTSFAPLYMMLTVVFFTTALALLPVGQACGRLMSRRAKLRAYGLNLLGSAIGVAALFVASLLWTPPVVWFAVAFLSLLVFVTYDRRPLLIGSAASLLALVAIWLPDRSPEPRRVYSPYQLLEFSQSGGEMVLSAAGHYFQRVVDLSDDNVRKNPSLSYVAGYYEFPYRVAGRPKKICVVGAGMGNDVAAALRMNAGQVDAIEIDPAIIEFGRDHHPEKPYHDPRVRPIANDARTFLRTTNEHYDMIVYGLLDSHTLLSHGSSVRVDSFVYTVEGFREAFARLRDGGVLSISFSIVDPVLGIKIFQMLREATSGQMPICVRAHDYDQALIFLVGKNRAIQMLDQHPEFADITFEVNRASRVDLSTDDWPFFYMPYRVYPLSYLPMAFVILACTAALTWGFLGLGRPTNDHRAFFFLGAGFMLVETKAITELGLAFGNTWHVIGIVIIGILFMALLANIAVAYCGFRGVNLTFVLLVASLLAGYWFAASSEVKPTMIGKLVTTAVLTCPMFFSGIVFSTLLRNTGQISEIMAANLLGAMLGGILEYNSMYFGFRFLYLMAIGVYVLAWLYCSRSRR